MEIPYELEAPFEYSWGIVKILLIIIILLVGILIYYRFFHQKIKEIMNKPNIPNLKNRYLRKLERLHHDVMQNRVDIRVGYMRLSNIIREFIEKATGLNILSLSKEEAKKMNMKYLSVLMEEYYPPEFAKVSSSDIISSINKTMEVIRRWN